MVFEKIANVITKHYKMVLAIWIVALLVSVPAMLQVDKAIQYQSDFGAVDGYESIKASEIIEKEFQGSVANGTLIILLQADDVTNAQTRDFVLQLQREIEGNPDIKYLQNASSVYTYSEAGLEEVIMQMGPVLRQYVPSTEQNVSMGAFLLWGVPAMHLQNWTESFSDSEAYNSTYAFLDYYLTQSHADPATAALALGYYNAFADHWNKTAAPNPVVHNPVDRLNVSVALAGQDVIANIPDPQIKSMMLAVLSTFSFEIISDEKATEATAHALTLSMIGNMVGISNTTYIEDIYKLGPVYDSSVVRPYASSLVENETLATLPYFFPESMRSEIMGALSSNFVSANNQSMLFMVTFTVASDYTEADGSKPLMDNTQHIREEIKQLKASTGAAVTTYVTGDAAISADMEASSTNDMKMIEPITIIIIIVLMGALFRSIFGQFLPLGAVGVAIGISQALVFVIGSTIAQINYTVLTMLFAVLMGVGTDYSIFIISRYREERVRGATREQAVHTAITWAGESIVTSGATVIIAFFAMALAQFTFVQTMGLLLGMAIVVALLISLTMVPAILMLLGNRIFWPTTGKRFENYSKKLMERKAAGNHGYFHRAASFSVKHAKVVILVAILVSIPTTYIYVTQETSFDFIGSMGNAESIDGMNAMSDDFGAGKIMPTQIVVTGGTVVYNGTFNVAYLDAIDDLTATIAADPMVQKVTSVTRPNGEAQAVDYANYSTLSPTTQAAMVSMVGKSNQSVLLTVVLKEEPQSADAVNYVSTMRNELAAIKADHPALAASTILVGGSTAMLHDMSLDISQQFTNIEVLVIVGIFIVLMIVLGSLLLPAFAVVSIAMSISWAFAATTLVFGTWLGKPILWIIPLILFVMLMGIGMDYNVFILTRIREEVHKGKKIKQAVVDAVDWTGGIITALALIMAGAFGSIMLSSNVMLQEFGFALFLAVLLDAMVVRTYIVPAAVVLMGKWAWWAPGRLQRVGREEKLQAKNGRQKTD